MSSQTTNLNLVKPADGEAADISVINGNMDTIDTAVGDLRESVSHMRVHSLIRRQELVDGQTYELYGGRKLSDYTHLIVEVISNGIIRTTNICTRVDFVEANGGLFTDVFHGVLDSSTGLPSSMSRIIFTYVDDTHVKVFLNGTRLVKQATLMGFNFL